MTSTQHNDTQKNTKNTTNTEALPNGQFCWMALRTPDVERARAFYGHVVGWTLVPPTAQMPMSTFVAEKGAVAHVEDSAGAARFGCYVVVVDRDKAVKRVVAAGGRVVGDVVDMPGVGVMREIADPAGATVSLFQPRGAAQAQPVSGQGSLAWSELVAADDAAAVAFLTAVIGYGVDSMPNNPGYTLLTSGGAARAGVMKARDKAAPSSWIPYLSVADADVAVARAVEKGATVVVPAVTVAGAGRFAVVVDPQGALVGLLARAA